METTAYRKQTKSRAVNSIICVERRSYDTIDKCYGLIINTEEQSNNVSNSEIMIVNFDEHTVVSCNIDRRIVVC